MREYRVVVDGKEFVVSVEALGKDRPATIAPKAAPAAPKAAAPAPKAAPAAPKAAPKAASGAGSIVAPMPGNVLEVKVNVGDSVNDGDVVMLLEAMKMEIEVTSTASGTVKSISVAKGATVNTGDVLVVVE